MTPPTPQNITRHELIGLEAEVAESPCQSQVKTSGRILDESRNLLIIAQGGGVRRIPKEGALFIFKLAGGVTVEVEGRRLLGRPEDRLKRILRRRW